MSHGTLHTASQSSGLLTVQNFLLQDNTAFDFEKFHHLPACVRWCDALARLIYLAIHFGCVQTHMYLKVCAASQLRNMLDP